MKKNRETVLNIALLAVIVALPLIFCRSFFKESRELAPDQVSFNGVATDEVHFAIQPSAAFIPLYVAKEEGWLDEAMAQVGVTVHWHSFDAGPAINESLLSGESDVGVLGDVPTVFAIALGQENVIIATAAQAADSYAVLVPADSEITEASQLKGKRFATVIGTTAHNLMDKYLASGGLTDEDIKFVNVNAGDVANVLKYDGADAAATWEPSVTRLADSGVARVLGEGSDCGLAGTNTLVARRDFAYNNPELVRIINEQYLRGAAALEKGLDQETAGKIAEYMKLDEEQIDKLLPKFRYTVEVTKEDIDSLNDTIEFLYKEKQIPEIYDISEYVARQ
ncbi:MAG: ABC transporter substrate-binding protein [Lachnospiraceae bacterium]|nr:ABC transporter substrate-binding protein [Lachnospiraceae bacterium]